MACVYLGLGTNVGVRESQLERALTELSKLGRITRKSRVYETKPWGKIDQPDFLNMCIEFMYPESSLLLIEKVKHIEKKLGRVQREKWGPREIDIDILLFDDKIINTGQLVVPHPHMLERAFVMVPLAEIAQDVRHPVERSSIGQLAAGINKSSVQLHSSL